MGHAGDPFGDVQDAFLQLVGWEGPVGVSDPYRLGGVHGVAGQDHLHGIAEADQPGVYGEVRGTGHSQDRVRDGGVVGQVDEVAGGGQLGAPGHGVAVDLGDDRLGQVPQRQPAVRDVAGP